MCRRQQLRKKYRIIYIYFPEITNHNEAKFHSSFLIEIVLTYTIILHLNEPQYKHKMAEFLPW